MNALSLKSLFIIILLSQSVAAQGDGHWRGIVPLNSRRSQVEVASKGLATDDFGQIVSPDGNVSVLYADEPCIGTGWNVPTGTVLEYTVYHRAGLRYSDLESRLQGMTPVVDHIGSTYYTDDARGVQFAFDRSRRLSYVRHFPESRNNQLRCEGFPPFSAVTSIYRLHDSFKLRDSEDDVGSASDFFSSVMKRLNQRGYIFIYFHTTDSKAKQKRVLKRFTDMINGLSSHSARRISVEIGGYRDTAQFDLFLLEATYPAPVPTPKYAGRK